MTLLLNNKIAAVLLQPSTIYLEMCSVQLSAFLKQPF